MSSSVSNIYHVHHFAKAVTCHFTVACSSLHGSTTTNRSLCMYDIRHIAKGL